MTLYWGGAEVFDPLLAMEKDGAGKIGLMPPTPWEEGSSRTKGGGGIRRSRWLIAIAPKYSFLSRPTQPASTTLTAAGAALKRKILN